MKDSSKHKTDRLPKWERELVAEGDLHRLNERHAICGKKPVKTVKQALASEYNLDQASAIVGVGHADIYEAAERLGLVAVVDNFPLLEHCRFSFEQLGDLVDAIRSGKKEVNS